MVTPWIITAVLVVGASLVVGILSARKNGNRVMGFVFGGLLVFMGGVGLMSGSLGQRWKGGPPLEGPLATIASAFILAVGLYTIYLLASSTSDDRSPKK